MSGPAELAHALASHLGAVLQPRGFKYQKSLRSFRRNTTYGQDVIDVDVKRNQDGSYMVSFIFGVRHTAVEDQRARFGLPTDRTMATVVQNSFNIHPNRPIDYPGPTLWSVPPAYNWAGVLPEVLQFLEAVVLPWLEKYADPQRLRASVVADDGWVIALQPWEIVAALDIPAGRAPELARYLDGLRPTLSAWPRQQLGTFVKSLATFLPADFVATW
jgi:hypothetical protein